MQSVLCIANSTTSTYQTQLRHTIIMTENRCCMKSTVRKKIEVKSLRLELLVACNIAKVDHMFSGCYYFLFNVALHLVPVL